MPDIRVSLATYDDPPESLVFDPTPEALPGDESMNAQEWDFVDGPSASNARTHKPPTFTLAGFFAGGHDYGQPWARPQYWRPPRDISAQIRRWMRSATVLRILVTETDIDADVQIMGYRRRWGELDRLYYELDLTESQPLTIESVPAAQVGGRDAEATLGTGIPSGLMPKIVPEVYTIKDATETLWGIAGRFYGNVEMWGEIWETNRAERGGPLADFMGPFEPGTELTMPQGISGVRA